jgi:transcriptional regulator with XRE-family HTH domain
VSPETFRKRVAARIQRARWRLDLTQADAAFKIGLTARYFAEIERAKRNPTLDVLFAVAQGLRVKVADLVDVEPGQRTDLDSMKLAAPKTGRKPLKVTRARR